MDVLQKGEYIGALELRFNSFQGSNGCPANGAVGVLKLHIQMDLHADGLAVEPGCGVSMGALRASMWMHTDT